jgi:hypothetical protein
VVSNSELQADLIANCPESIASFSKVIYFPYLPSIGRLLGIHPELKAAVENLCASDRPELDKVECVATVLLGAIVSSNDDQQSVSEILERARSCSPNYIRTVAGLSRLSISLVTTRTCIGVNILF